MHVGDKGLVHRVGLSLTQTWCMCRVKKQARLRKRQEIGLPRAPLLFQASPLHAAWAGAVQMRRWTISRRQPLQFKPPEMIACTSRVIIAASRCGLQGMGSWRAAWHSTSMPDVLCQVEWPGLKCSSGGRGGKKTVSWFKTLWMLHHFHA